MLQNTRLLGALWEYKNSLNCAYTYGCQIVSIDNCAWDSVLEAYRGIPGCALTSCDLGLISFPQLPYYCCVRCAPFVKTNIVVCKDNAKMHLRSLLQPAPVITAWSGDFMEIKDFSQSTQRIKQDRCSCWEVSVRVVNGKGKEKKLLFCFGIGTFQMELSIFFSVSSNWKWNSSLFSFWFHGGFMACWDLSLKLQEQIDSLFKNFSSDEPDQKLSLVVAKWEYLAVTFYFFFVCAP